MSNKTLAMILRDRGIDEPRTLDLAGRLAPQPLFPGQVRLLEQTRLLQGEGVLWLAPTGSGKSLAGDAAVAMALTMGGGGGMAMWLAPTRTLARERGKALEAALGPAGFRVVVSSREDRAADDAIRAGRVDLVATVYEKARLLLLQSSVLREGLRLVVADEIALLDDPSRGPGAGMLLHALAMGDPAPVLVALGCGLAQPADVARRFGVTLQLEHSRPVELRRGEIRLDLGQRLVEAPGGGEPAVEQFPLQLEADEMMSPAHLATLVAEMPKPLLVFTPTRIEARQLAMSLTEERAAAAPCAVPDGETVMGRLLADLLPAGIAVHTAELTMAQRRHVEGRLRSGEVEVCFATTTLGEGINVGVRSVLVLAPSCWQPCVPLENLLGRAGRPGVGPGEAWVVRRAPASPRESRQGAPAAPTGDAALAGAALMLGMMGGEPVTPEQLRTALGRMPLGESPEAVVSRGVREGAWELVTDGRLSLTPLGRLVATGMVPPGVVAGWRTILRRFPEGGATAANWFLALGGLGAVGGVTMSQDERQECVWPARLAEELGGDRSGLARYFAQHLSSGVALPRATHLACKAVCLLLEAGRGATMATLERDFAMAAGLLEEAISAARVTVLQMEQFAAAVGAALVPTAQHADAGAQPDVAPPGEPLVLRGAHRQIARGQRSLVLTRNQFAFLELLARNAGEVVPYERLDAHVWQDNKVQRQQISYYRAALCRLLEELFPGRSDLVQTYSSLGLRLCLEPGEVRLEDAISRRTPRPMLRDFAPLRGINFVARPVCV